MILGLDISTTKIGIAVFTEDGLLEELTHVSLKGKSTEKNKFTKKKVISYGQLYKKVEAFEKYLINNLFKKYDFSEVVVEAPLTTSSKSMTAAILNVNSGLIYHMLRKYFKNENIKYISVDDARRYGFPEIVRADKNGKKGSNGVLFGELNEKIRELKKEIKPFKLSTSACKKMSILYLVSKRFPSIVWNLNRAYNLEECSYDKADAVAAILGYKVLSEQWEVEDLDDNVLDDIMFFIKESIIHKKMQSELSSKDTEASLKKMLKEELAKNHYKKFSIVTTS